MLRENSSENERQLTLDEEFLQGYTAFHQSRQSALGHFIQLDLKIQKLSLFSRNETREDINDKYLKFMLVPAFIGLGLVDWSGGRDREAVLKKSNYYLKQFLDLMENYEFLSTQDQKWLDQVESKQKPKVELIRDIKISQYKREKETMAKVKVLQDKPDAEIDFYYAVFDLVIQQSINAIKDVQDELEMLEFAKLRISSKPTAAVEDSNKLDDKPKLTQYSGPMLSSAGKPLRPFVITSEHNKREEIRKGVFRPGHNLPTMTVEEYIDREMERGNYLSGGGKIPEKEEVDEDDEEYANQATYKAREWDEFKDFNPAGWGNRHNKG